MASVMASVMASAIEDGIGDGISDGIGDRRWYPRDCDDDSDSGSKSTLAPIITSRPTDSAQSIYGKTEKTLKGFLRKNFEKPFEKH